MRVVILAAGYGTRLQRELAEDRSGQYDHLKGLPKPLLPIGGDPLINHWIRCLEALQPPHRALVEDVVVVVNGANRQQFESWRCELDTRLRVRLLKDNSTSNQSRSGAITCMQLAVADYYERNVLFIGGDTLFRSDFSLDDFLDAAELRMRDDPMSCHVTAVPCAEERVHKHGIIELNDIGRVTGFKEKPLPSETISRVQCPCFYLLSAASISLLTDYLTAHTTLAERDATGLLVAYLVNNSSVFAHQVSHRYDVGCLDSYLACCRDFNANSI